MTLRGIALSIEYCIAASPVWLRLVDTFTGRAPAGPIEVVVERRDANRWLRVHVPYELKPSGDLAFVNLGRVRPGEAGQQLDFRVTATADRTISETVSGAPSIVQTVTTWTPDAPPATPAVREIRFYPGPDYRYGPGVPLLAGTVAFAAGNPAGRARVWATETVRGKTLIEEVRTNDDGWFRLPLRWSSATTQINAERQGASGSTTINVPADLGSVVSITIS